MSGGRPDAPSGGWGTRWSQAAGPDGELPSSMRARPVGVAEA